MIGLVYLVWAPLGPGPLRAFLGSYHTHPAGVEHELTVVLNGAQREAGGFICSPEAVLGELGETKHRLIVLDRPMLDLAAYGEATRRVEHRWLCFLNSYSVVLADDWLGHLARAAALPGVGLVGATGSWESKAELVHGSAMHWAYQLVKLRDKRRDFPRFPNPHIRTTGFMLERQIAIELNLDRSDDKYAAYLLESGRRSITRRVEERGLRPVVVGRDGRTFEVDDWQRSCTYRSGEQSNLLVADNRTRDWCRASPQVRQRLSRMAWGSVDRSHRRVRR